MAIEVEVQTLDEVDEVVIAAGVEIILMTTYRLGTSGENRRACRRAR